jgi:hypothetical protein
MEFSQHLSCPHGCRADVLVGNAGISFIAPAENVEGKAFIRVLEVKSTHTFFCWPPFI